MSFKNYPNKMKYYLSNLILKYQMKTTKILMIGLFNTIKLKKLIWRVRPLLLIKIHFFLIIIEKEIIQIMQRINSILITTQ
jgi:hypothetical protein